MALVNFNTFQTLATIKRARPQELDCVRNGDDSDVLGLRECVVINTVDPVVA